MTIEREQREERAERIRSGAELAGAILTDVVAVVVEHADAIAAWTLDRRGAHGRRRDAPTAPVTLRSVKPIESLDRQ